MDTTRHDTTRHDTAATAAAATSVATSTDPAPSSSATDTVLDAAAFFLVVSSSPSLPPLSSVWPIEAFHVSCLLMVLFMIGKSRNHNHNHNHNHNTTRHNTTQHSIERNRNESDTAQSSVESSRNSVDKKNKKMVVTPVRTGSITHTQQ